MQNKGYKIGIGAIIATMWGGVSLLANANPLISGPNPALTFDQALRATLRQAPAMLAANSKKAMLKGALRQARGNLLPKLNASFTGMGSNNALNVFGMKLNQRVATFNDFGASQFNPTDPSSLYTAPANLDNPGWYRDFQTKIQLQIPVFNGGQIWNAVHSVQAYLDAAQQGQIFARQQVELGVLKAYEGVLATKAFVSVARKALKAADSYVTLTNKLYQRGVVSKNAQLRALLNRGNVRLKLKSAQVHLEEAKEQLRILIGLPPDHKIHIVSGVFIRVPEISSLSSLQQDLLQDNPALRALGDQVRAAQSGVWQARAAYFPHFNIVVSREWDNRSFAIGGSPSYTVAGVLHWNLFDFGARRGAVDQAQAKVLERRAALRRQQNEMKNQVTSAWLNVSLAKERVKVRNLAIRQATEDQRLQNLRYQNGAATITQLLTAQADLDKARGELVAARYQEIMQEAGLLLAMGKLMPNAVVQKDGAH